MERAAEEHRLTGATTDFCGPAAPSAEARQTFSENVRTLVNERVTAVVDKICGTDPIISRRRSVSAPPYHKRHRQHVLLVEKYAVNARLENRGNCPLQEQIRTHNLAELCVTDKEAEDKMVDGVTPLKEDRNTSNDQMLTTKAPSHDGSALQPCSTDQVKSIAPVAGLKATDKEGTPEHTVSQAADTCVGDDIASPTSPEEADVSCLARKECAEGKPTQLRRAALCAPKQEWPVLLSSEGPEKMMSNRTEKRGKYRREARMVWKLCAYSKQGPAQQQQHYQNGKEISVQQHESEDTHTMRQRARATHRSEKVYWRKKYQADPRMLQQTPASGENAPTDNGRRRPLQLEKKRLRMRQLTQKRRKWQSVPAERNCIEGNHTPTHFQKQSMPQNQVEHGLKVVKWMWQPKEETHSEQQRASENWKQVTNNREDAQPKESEEERKEGKSEETVSADWLSVQQNPKRQLQERCTYNCRDTRQLAQENEQAHQPKTGHWKPALTSNLRAENEVERKSLQQEEARADPPLLDTEQVKLLVETKSAEPTDANNESELRQKQSEISGMPPDPRPLEQDEAEESVQQKAARTLLEQQTDIEETKLHLAETKRAGLSNVAEESVLRQEQGEIYGKLPESRHPDGCQGDELSLQQGEAREFFDQPPQTDQTHMAKRVKLSKATEETTVQRTYDEASGKKPMQNHPKKPGSEKEPSLEDEAEVPLEHPADAEQTKLHLAMTKTAGSGGVKDQTALQGRQGEVNGNVPESSNPGEQQSKKKSRKKRKATKRPPTPEDKERSLRETTCVEMRDAKEQSVVQQADGEVREVSGEVPMQSCPEKHEGEKKPLQQEEARESLPQPSDMEQIGQEVAEAKRIESGDGDKQSAPQQQRDEEQGKLPEPRQPEEHQEKKSRKKRKTRKMKKTPPPPEQMKPISDETKHVESTDAKDQIMVQQTDGELICRVPMRKQPEEQEGEQNLLQQERASESVPQPSETKDIAQETAEAKRVESDGGDKQSVPQQQRDEEQGKLPEPRQPEEHQEKKKSRKKRKTKKMKKAPPPPEQMKPISDETKHVESADAKDQIMVQQTDGELICRVPMRKQPEEQEGEQKLLQQERASESVPQLSETNEIGQELAEAKRVESSDAREESPSQEKQDEERENRVDPGHTGEAPAKKKWRKKRIRMKFPPAPPNKKSTLAKMKRGVWSDAKEQSSPKETDDEDNGKVSMQKHFEEQECEEKPVQEEEASESLPQPSVTELVELESAEAKLVESNDRLKESVLRQTLGEVNEELAESRHLEEREGERMLSHQERVPLGHPPDAETMKQRSSETRRAESGGAEELSLLQQEDGEMNGRIREPRLHEEHESGKAGLQQKEATEPLCQRSDIKQSEPRLDETKLVKSADYAEESVLQKEHDEVNKEFRGAELCEEHESDNAWLQQERTREPLHRPPSIEQTEPSSDGTEVTELRECKDDSVLQRKPGKLDEILMEPRHPEERGDEKKPSLEDEAKVPLEHPADAEQTKLHLAMTKTAGSGGVKDQTALQGRQGEVNGNVPESSNPGEQQSKKKSRKKRKATKRPPTPEDKERSLRETTCVEMRDAKEQSVVQQADGEVREVSGEVPMQSCPEKHEGEKKPLQQEEARESLPQPSDMEQIGQEVAEAKRIESGDGDKQSAPQQQRDEEQGKLPEPRQPEEHQEKKSRKKRKTRKMKKAPPPPEQMKPISDETKHVESTDAKDQIMVQQTDGELICRVPMRKQPEEQEGEQNLLQQERASESVPQPSETKDIAQETAEAKRVESDGGDKQSVPQQQRDEEQGKLPEPRQPEEHQEKKKSRKKRKKKMKKAPPPPEQMKPISDETKHVESADAKDQIMVQQTDGELICRVPMRKQPEEQEGEQKLLQQERASESVPQLSETNEIAQETAEAKRVESDDGDKQSAPQQQRDEEQGKLPEPRQPEEHQEKKKSRKKRKTKKMKKAPPPPEQMKPISDETKHVESADAKDQIMVQQTDGELICRVPMQKQPEEQEGEQNLLQQERASESVPQLSETNEIAQETAEAKRVESDDGDKQSVPQQQRDEEQGKLPEPRQPEEHQEKKKSRKKRKTKKMKKAPPPPEQMKPISDETKHVESADAKDQIMVQQTDGELICRIPMQKQPEEQEGGQKPLQEERASELVPQLSETNEIGQELAEAKRVESSDAREESPSQEKQDEERENRVALGHTGDAPAKKKWRKKRIRMKFPLAPPNKKSTLAKMKRGVWSDAKEQSSPKETDDEDNGKVSMQKHFEEQECEEKPVQEEEASESLPQPSVTELVELESAEAKLVESNDRLKESVLRQTLGEVNEELAESRHLEEREGENDSLEQEEPKASLEHLFDAEQMELHVTETKFVKLSDAKEESLPQQEDSGANRKFLVQRQDQNRQDKEISLQQEEAREALLQARDVEQGIQHIAETKRVESSTLEEGSVLQREYAEINRKLPEHWHAQEPQAEKMLLRPGEAREPRERLPEPEQIGLNLSQMKLVASGDAREHSALQQTLGEVDDNLQESRSYEQLRANDDLPQQEQARKVPAPTPATQDEDLNVAETKLSRSSTFKEVSVVREEHDEANGKLPEPRSHQEHPERRNGLEQEGAGKSLRQPPNTRHMKLELVETNRLEMRDAQGQSPLQSSKGGPLGEVLEPRHPGECQGENNMLQKGKVRKSLPQPPQQTGEDGGGPRRLDSGANTSGERHFSGTLQESEEQPSPSVAGEELKSRLQGVVKEVTRKMNEKPEWNLALTEQLLSALRRLQERKLHNYLMQWREPAENIQVLPGIKCHECMQQRRAVRNEQQERQLKSSEKQQQAERHEVQSLMLAGCEARQESPVATQVEREKRNMRQGRCNLPNHTMKVKPAPHGRAQPPRSGYMGCRKVNWKRETMSQKKSSLRSTDVLRVRYRTGTAASPQRQGEIKSVETPQDRFACDNFGGEIVTRAAGKTIASLSSLPSLITAHKSQLRCGSASSITYANSATVVPAHNARGNAITLSVAVGAAPAGAEKVGPAKEKGDLVGATEDFGISDTLFSINCTGVTSTERTQSSDTVEGQAEVVRGRKPSTSARYEIVVASTTLEGAMEDARAEAIAQALLQRRPAAAAARDVKESHKFTTTRDGEEKPRCEEPQKGGDERAIANERGMSKVSDPAPEAEETFGRKEKYQPRKSRKCALTLRKELRTPEHHCIRPKKSNDSIVCFSADGLEMRPSWWKNFVKRPDVTARNCMFQKFSEQRIRRCNFELCIGQTDAPSLNANMETTRRLGEGVNCRALRPLSMLYKFRVDSDDVRLYKHGLIYDEEDQACRTAYPQRHQDWERDGWCCQQQLERMRTPPVASSICAIGALAAVDDAAARDEGDSAATPAAAVAIRWIWAPCRTHYASVRRLGSLFPLFQEGKGGMLEMQAIRRWLPPQAGQQVVEQEHQRQLMNHTLHTDDELKQEKQKAEQAEHCWRLWALSRREVQPSVITICVANCQRLSNGAASTLERIHQQVHKQLEPLQHSTTSHRQHNMRRSRQERETENKTLKSVRIEAEAASLQADVPSCGGDTLYSHTFSSDREDEASATCSPPSLPEPQLLSSAVGSAERKRADSPAATAGPAPEKMDRPLEEMHLREGLVESNISALALNGLEESRSTTKTGKREAQPPFTETQSIVEALCKDDGAFKEGTETRHLSVAASGLQTVEVRMHAIENVSQQRGSPYAAEVAGSRFLSILPQSSSWIPPGLRLADTGMLSNGFCVHFAVQVPAGAADFQAHSLTPTLLHKSQQNQQWSVEQRLRGKEPHLSTEEEGYVPLCQRTRQQHHQQEHEDLQERSHQEEIGKENTQTQQGPDTTHMQPPEEIRHTGRKKQERGKRQMKEKQSSCGMLLSGANLLESSDAVGYQDDSRLQRSRRTVALAALSKGSSTSSNRNESSADSSKSLLVKRNEILCNCSVQEASERPLLVELTGGSTERSKKTSFQLFMRHFVGSSQIARRVDIAVRLATTEIAATAPEKATENDSVGEAAAKAASFEYTVALIKQEDDSAQKSAAADLRRTEVNRASPEASEQSNTRGEEKGTTAAQILTSQAAVVERQAAIHEAVGAEPLQEETEERSEECRTRSQAAKGIEELVAGERAPEPAAVETESAPSRTATEQPPIAQCRAWLTSEKLAEKKALLKRTPSASFNGKEAGVCMREATSSLLQRESSNAKEAPANAVNEHLTEERRRIEKGRKAPFPASDMQGAGTKWSSAAATPTVELVSSAAKTIPARAATNQPESVISCPPAEREQRKVEGRAPEGTAAKTTMAERVVKPDVEGDIRAAADRRTATEQKAFEKGGAAGKEETRRTEPNLERRVAKETALKWGLASAITPQAQNVAAQGRAKTGKRATIGTHAVAKETTEHGTEPRVCLEPAAVEKPAVKASAAVEKREALTRRGTAANAAPARAAATTKKSEERVPAAAARDRNAVCFQKHQASDGEAVQRGVGRKQAAERSHAPIVAGPEEAPTATIEAGSAAVKVEIRGAACSASAFHGSTANALSANRSLQHTTKTPARPAAGATPKFTTHIAEGSLELATLSLEVSRKRRSPTSICSHGSVKISSGGSEAALEKNSYSRLNSQEVGAGRIRGCLPQAARLLESVQESGQQRQYATDCSKSEQRTEYSKSSSTSQIAHSEDSKQTVDAGDAPGRASISSPNGSSRAVNSVTSSGTSSSCSCRYAGDGRPCGQASSLREAKSSDSSSNTESSALHLTRRRSLAYPVALAAAAAVSRTAPANPTRTDAKQQLPLSAETAAETGRMAGLQQAAAPHSATSCIPRPPAATTRHLADTCAGKPADCLTPSTTIPTSGRIAAAPAATTAAAYGTLEGREGPTWEHEKQPLHSSSGNAVETGGMPALQQAAALNTATTRVPRPAAATNRRLADTCARKPADCLTPTTAIPTLGGNAASPASAAAAAYGTVKERGDCTWEHEKQPLPFCAGTAAEAGRMPGLQQAAALNTAKTLIPRPPAATSRHLAYTGVRKPADCLTPSTKVPTLGGTAATPASAAAAAYGIVKGRGDRTWEHEKQPLPLSAGTAAETGRMPGVEQAAALSTGKTRIPRPPAAANRPPANTCAGTPVDFVTPSATIPTSGGIAVAPAGAEAAADGPVEGGGVPTWEHEEQPLLLSAGTAAETGSIPGVEQAAALSTGKTRIPRPPAAANRPPADTYSGMPADFVTPSATIPTSGGIAVAPAGAEAAADGPVEGEGVPTWEHEEQPLLLFAGTAAVAGSMPGLQQVEALNTAGSRLRRALAAINRPPADFCVGMPADFVTPSATLSPSGGIAVAPAAAEAAADGPVEGGGVPTWEREEQPLLLSAGTAAEARSMPGLQQVEALNTAGSRLRRALAAINRPPADFCVGMPADFVTPSATLSPSGGIAVAPAATEAAADGPVEGGGVPTWEHEEQPLLLSAGTAAETGSIPGVEQAAALSTGKTRIPRPPAAANRPPADTYSGMPADFVTPSATIPTSGGIAVAPAGAEAAADGPVEGEGVPTWEHEEQPLLLSAGTAAVAGSMSGLQQVEALNTAGSRLRRALAAINRPPADFCVGMPADFVTPSATLSPSGGIAVAPAAAEAAADGPVEGGGVPTWEREEQPLLLSAGTAAEAGSMPGLQQVEALNTAGSRLRRALAAINRPPADFCVGMPADFVTPSATLSPSGGIAVAPAAAEAAADGPVEKGGLPTWEHEEQPLLLFAGTAAETGSMPGLQQAPAVLNAYSAWTSCLPAATNCPRAPVCVSTAADGVTPIIATSTSGGVAGAPAPAAALAAAAVARAAVFSTHSKTAARREAVSGRGVAIPCTTARVFSRRVRPRSRTPAVCSERNSIRTTQTSGVEVQPHVKSTVACPQAIGSAPNQHATPALSTDSTAHVSLAASETAPDESNSVAGGARTGAAVQPMSSTVTSSIATIKAAAASAIGKFFEQPEGLAAPPVSEAALEQHRQRLRQRQQEERRTEQQTPHQEDEEPVNELLLHPQRHELLQANNDYLLLQLQQNLGYAAYSQQVHTYMQLQQQNWQQQYDMYELLPPTSSNTHFDH